MTVLNLMLGRGKGGIEQACVDYAEALLHAGIPTLTVTQPGAAVNEVLASAHLPNTHIRSLGEWDPIAKFRLRHIIKQNNITAIIAHGNRAIGTALKAAKGRVPIAAPTHNYKLKRFAKIDAAFAATQDLAKAVKQLGLRSDRIYTMPNAVRIEEAPIRAPMRKPPIIGTMGRFVPKKGFDVFIDAVALLASRGIHVNAKLGGSGEREQEYREKIQRLQLQNRIELIGWVENKNIFFDSLDLFILPSHHEPFGIVLLEAQARCVPVISTMSEGPREIIEQDVTGHLTSLASAEFLADAIEHAIANPDTIETWAKNARARVESTYSIEALGQRLKVALADLGALPISAA